MVVQLDSKVLIALCGVVLLAVGVFLPVIEVPLFGSVDFFDLGKVDGAIVLLAAAAALALTLMGRIRYVGVPGVIALALIAYNYLNLQLELAGPEVGGPVPEGVPGEAIRGLAEVMRLEPSMAGS
jgi:hypothetical protein